MKKSKPPAQTVEQFAAETARELAELRSALHAAQAELAHMRGSLHGIPQIKPPHTKTPKSTSGGIAPFISGLAGYLTGSLIGESGTFYLSRTQTAGQLFAAAQRAQRIL